jgi:hypothetical protein
MSDNLPDLDVPTLRELNDAFLLFLDRETVEGVSLSGLLAHMPAEPRLARQHRAALALGWAANHPLRHSIKARFGDWGPPAFERVADWLTFERGWTTNPWDIRLDDLLRVLRPDTPPASVPVSRAPRRRCRLRIKGKTVFLDGEAINLDLPNQKRAAALCFLGHLLSAAPDWISSKTIDDAERAKPRAGLHGYRWSDVRRSLPAALSNLVESRTGAGYRLSPAAAHNFV